MLMKYERLVDKSSNHSVEQTVERLKEILRSKGVTLFALIDHSGEGGNENATDQAADLRQSEGRDPADASGAEQCH